jgi:hypothetical protein
MDTHKTVKKFSKLLGTKDFKIVKLRDSGDDVVKSFVRFSHPHLESLKFAGVTPYMTLTYTTAPDSRAKLFPELSIDGFNTIIHVGGSNYFEGISINHLLRKDVLSKSIPVFMDKVAKLMENISVLCGVKLDNKRKKELLKDFVTHRYNKNLISRHRFVYDEINYSLYEKVPVGFKAHDNLWNYILRVQINLYDENVQVLEPIPRVDRKTGNRSEDYQPVVFDESYNMKIYWNQYNVQFQPILKILEENHIGTEGLFKF